MEAGQVNSQIPLDVRVPPAFDPTTSYLNALRVKGAMQEQSQSQELQPGRVQGQQLQNTSVDLHNKQRQYTLNQQAIWAKSYQEAMQSQPSAAGQTQTTPPAATATPSSATFAAPTPAPLPMGPATPPDLATVGTPLPASPYDSPKQGNMDGTDAPAYDDLLNRQTPGQPGPSAVNLPYTTGAGTPPPA